MSTRTKQQILVVAVIGGIFFAWWLAVYMGWWRP